MELLVSAVVSLIVQGIKKWLGTNVYGTLVMLAAVSFCGAGVMLWLKSAGLWEAFVQIAVSAAGIYAILLKRFEQQDVVQ